MQGGRLGDHAATMCVNRDPAASPYQIPPREAARALLPLAPGFRIILTQKVNGFDEAMSEGGAGPFS